MNLPEKLAREIRRVAELRKDYEKLDGMPNVIVKPAMMMMNMALDAACEAAGMNDIDVQLAALRELEGFEK